MLTQWFDKTLMLTIRRELHGRAKMTMDHLRAEGIEAETFIGLDGEKTGLITTHTYELDNPGTNYRIGPKTVNMQIGHWWIWKTFEYLQGDSFLLLEDDARFVPGWKEHWNFARPQLPDDWDLLYVGSCCCMDRPRTQISGAIHKIEFALCTHAYGVRRKAIPIILEACERVYAGIDISIALHAIPKLNTYAFLPRLADQYKTEIAP